MYIESWLKQKKKITKMNMTWNHQLISNRCYPFVFNGFTWSNNNNLLFYFPSDNITANKLKVKYSMIESLLINGALAQLASTHPHNPNMTTSLHLNSSSCKSL